jgi:hypothetical protein
MSQVYQNAIRVLVWLDDDRFGTAKDCFEIIQELNRYLLELWDGVDRVFSIPQFIKPYPRTVDMVKRFSTSILQLLGLPWFNRVWVVQEAALAKDCIFALGESANEDS